jgi:SAM-dependent methyltransferase
LTARLRGLADNRRPGSLADRFRQRRFELLRGLVDGLPRPVRILDVGGTPSFWERVGYAGRDGLEIVLLNQVDQDPVHPNLTAVVGDAADLSAFADGTFDVVVSNSVIEHLPTRELQARMAAETRRVGRRLYLQTPNKYFPLEPHFLFPFFAMLPLNVRAFLLQHADLGWHPRQPDRRAALREVRSIRLMTGRELRHAFPGARIDRERILVFTKSFIVLDGWDPQEG